MKGIILAGGNGTRLFPLTSVTSKQLLPVYDKPMIYYPISVLMCAGIREILIISSPQDIVRFKQLLGNGEQFGIELHYEIQEKPEGLAQAFLIGKEFIGKDAVAMALGDNIFVGEGLDTHLERAALQAAENKSTIFAYKVEKPERFGVITFDSAGKATAIEEKPDIPQSNYCVTGLYFYDNSVTEYAESLTKSVRGELEITDLNNMYLEKGKLKVDILEEHITWMDAGTHNSLLEAGNFINKEEKRQNHKIACLEEIAYRKGWIDRGVLEKAAQYMEATGYGKYLDEILRGEQL